jgi:hypothetical protein
VHRLPSRSSRRSEDYDLRSVIIHSESPHNLKTIRDSVSLLKKITHPLRICIREFPRRRLSDSELSSLIKLRLINPVKRDERAIDSFALREFERRVMMGTAKPRGVPYEGLGLMAFYRNLIPEAERIFPEFHIIITDRLIMSWDEDESKYHARVVLFGIPSIISMSGLVEAPARAREYYIARQVADSIGIKNPLAARSFSGDFLEFDDGRTPFVLRGYLLQCIFYAMTGNPFCSDRDCMLFNAHWQEEMLHAQIESGRLCAHHRRELNERLSRLRPGS